MVSAEQLHLEIGLLGIFKDVHWNQLKQPLTSTWLTDLVFSLGNNDILLHYSLPQLYTQRQGGIFLSNAFFIQSHRQRIALPHGLQRILTSNHFDRYHISRW